MCHIHGKRANRLRKYLIHVVFVSLSYMLLRKKKKEETQEGALTIIKKKKKRKRLITNVNAIYLPFRQKAVDYNLFAEFVDFGGRGCERAEKNRTPRKQSIRRVCVLLRSLLYSHSLLIFFEAVNGNKRQTQLKIIYEEAACTAAAL